tara:strand:+ start:216 stop:1061 length:846 start_codon:yes stop_codon:yes gene_type:complete
MNKAIFIADFFAHEVAGGGELNNKILIETLNKKDYSVKTVNSHLVTKNFIQENKSSKYIIGNFINLPLDCREYLQSHCDYVIYEHDHKYLTSRNPAEYDDYLAPKEAIINFEFYEKANTVFCQSNFHSNIVRKNLQLDNIVNLGGNLWSDEALEYMRRLSFKEKKPVCSIMNSNIKHKNTVGAIKYCRAKSLEFELIEYCSPNEFLNRLSENDKLVFFPLTPETLSRIIIEARMMGMKVVTNGRVGATSEKWFKLKGEELISFMMEKREEIISTLEGAINE